MYYYIQLQDNEKEKKVYSTPDRLLMLPYNSSSNNNSEILFFGQNCTSLLKIIKKSGYEKKTSYITIFYKMYYYQINLGQLPVER